MEITYKTADSPWPLADGRGNHRILVSVPEAKKYVKAVVQWRRRDLNPENCAVLAYRMADDQPVNTAVLTATREYGSIVFEAPTAGNYALYYMPYVSKSKSWWAPTIDYSKHNFTGCTPEWAAEIPENIPLCSVKAIESRTAFDSFFPMEVPATQRETAELLSRHKDASFLLFPEDRRYPIRMRYDLPYRFIQAGAGKNFSGEACPDEYYVFQIGVYALRDLADITVTYTNFSGSIGIAPNAITCFNLEGIDWLGSSFCRKVCCHRHEMQPLWFGIQIPPDTSGTIAFDLAIYAGGEEHIIKITIAVSGENIPNNGDGELWRLSRLRWLNSTIGLDNEVPLPFTPVQVRENVLSCLGREVRLGRNGLPKEIISFFDASIHTGGKATQILREPVEWEIVGKCGKIEFTDFHTKTILAEAGVFAYQTDAVANECRIKNESRFEYDGHLETIITITAKRDLELSDIALKLAFTPECSRYMMGMGREGGLSGDVDYRWDINRTNNFLWIGAVNGGIHLKLKHTQDVWELYNYQKIGLPEGWHNNGAGGCRVTTGAGGATLRAYSGSVRIKANDSLTFRYSLQITPLKELDSDSHWQDRYDHRGEKGVDLAAAKAGGATVVNLHQGQPLNPYINYPFCRDEILKSEIEKAHELGIKYKLYYTVRELTTHAQEFFMVRSLNDEILSTGQPFHIAEHFTEDFFSENKKHANTGGPWLCEHLPEGYIAAWQTLLPDGEYDCSVGTVGLSRWHNYYLQGLSWLVREIGADGIYLDGVSYDRQIMKRVRKVLDSSKAGCLIDFHSGNNFHPEYGLCNVLGQYMELLPSIDSLWIGEGFDYENTSPEYWLVEISGIPFGLMGDMLHRGGNKWRGMIFGMTPRCNWPEGGSPLPIWRLWEKFGMKGCNICGWWDPASPVQLSRNDCKATAYLQEDRILISVASWAEQPIGVRVELQLPEQMKKANRSVRYTIPFIEGFQEEEAFYPGMELMLEPGRGKIIIVRLTDD